MSVLGTTKWHADTSKRPEGASDLVFGKYPLSFINEVRQEVGDHGFFMSNAARDFWDALGHNESSFARQIADREDTRGSMLPFTPNQTFGTYVRHRGVSFSTSKPETDPTVRDWRIQMDGSVIIPSARIIMSKSNAINVGEVELVHFLDARSGWEAVSSRQLMHKWIASQSYDCKAVLVMRDTMNDSDDKEVVRVEGLLLRELESDYIKIGTFLGAELKWSQAYEESIVEKVNWTVR